MEKQNSPPDLDALIAQWLRTAAALGADTAINVREEPHCPDPSCPLRHTVLEWAEPSGKARRVVVVKPLAYVREADVQRAWRNASLGDRH